MKRGVLTGVSLVVLVLMMVPVPARPLDGEAEYQRGDYGAAMSKLLPAALGGNATAMLDVGRMYELGLGTARNIPEAYAWYNLAAGEGNREAVQLLIRLEDHISEADLEQGDDRLEALTDEVDRHRAATGGAPVDHGRGYPAPSTTRPTYPPPPAAPSYPPPATPRTAPVPRAAPMAGMAAAGHWTTDHSSPHFTVDYPAGWQRTGPQSDGRILLRGPRGESVVIWPYYVRQSLSAAGGGSLLQGFARELEPGLPWSTPRALDRNVVQVKAAGGGRLAVADLTMVEGRSGTAGTLYCIAAPADIYRQDTEIYTRILRSFHLVGSDQPRGNGAVAPDLRYTTWQDPREQGFSLDCPQGWSVEGGTVRRASVDVVFTAVLTSPDRRIRLFIGDGQTPVCVVPSQQLAMAGFREGSWYSPGYGFRTLVARYLTGAQFAAYYARRACGQGGSFAITGQRDRPDSATEINRIFRQNGMQVLRQQLNTGEVTFSFDAGGTPGAGYIFAGTLLNQANPAMGNFAFWQVDHLYGCAAEASRLAEAETVLAHVVASIRINPAWLRMQANLNGQVSRIVAETGEYISNLVHQAAAVNDKSWDHVNENFANYILGQEDVRDPETGRSYKVESGSNYYWVDHSGNIVGTDLDVNPNQLRFHDMVILNR